MPTCLSLDLSLIRVSRCGSPFKLSHGLAFISTLSMALLEPRINIAKLSHDLAALSSFKSTTAVHVKLVASVASQIISLPSCMGSVAHIMTRFLFSVVNSALIQLFPGIARFSCPMILCVILNFGRTMSCSQQQNLLGGFFTSGHS